MKRQTKDSSKEVDLPFKNGVPVKPVAVAVQFDTVAWIKDLLTRPVGQKEMAS